MAGPAFLDRTAAALLKAAEGTLMRQEVIAANLANAETPGYRAVEVDFEKALAKALESRRTRQGGAEDILRAPVWVRLRPAPRLRWDENNVNAEQEIVDLAEAAAQHDAVVRLLARKLRMLHLAISGRPE
ncbi:MAG: flagellar basal body rod protein FlgB [Armatimonadetes bacterium]|nr:flagellar basal body rod protein FlgB [Armatimonadota bacterium]